MQVVKPVEFTDGMITSNSLADLNSPWDSGTTYAAGALVTYNKRTYESLQASNTNHDPTSSPTWWLDIGPSNRWAIFDNQVSTVSTATTSFTLVFRPGQVDTIAVLNVFASEVSLTVKDEPGGAIIYDSNQALDGSVVFDWYQYFFFDISSLRTQAIFRGIPLVANCEVTLTVSIDGVSEVYAGQIVAGMTSNLGHTQYGLSAGILDFSKKETDEYGNTSFVVRSYSKRMNPTIYINNNELNRVQRVLYSLRAIPALWIASDEPLLEETTVVFGFYRDFSTEITYPTYSACTMEIEGLI